MVTFDIISALALTHVANHNPAIFLAPSCTKKNIKFLTEKRPQQIFCPDNSNMLHMFKNNIYNDFRTA